LTLNDKDAWFVYFFSSQGRLHYLSKYITVLALAVVT